MKLLKSLLTFIFVTQSSLMLAAPLWRTNEAINFYHNHSTVQTHWAWDVLFDNMLLTGEETILDYGAGEGKLSYLMSKLVPKGKVLGVDISPEMVDFSRYKFPNHEFSNLSFSTITENNPVSVDEGEFNLITSFCVFHLVQNPIHLLKSFYNILKPGGKVVAVFPFREPSHPFALAMTRAIKKYEVKLRNFSQESIQLNSNVLALTAFSEPLGFRVLLNRKKETKDHFISRADFADWIEGTLSGNFQFPKDKQRQVAEEIANDYIELDPSAIDEQGRVTYTYFVIEFVAEK